MKKYFLVAITVGFTLPAIAQQSSNADGVPAHSMTLEDVQALGDAALNTVGVSSCDLSMAMNLPEGMNACPVVSFDINGVRISLYQKYQVPLSCDARRTLSGNFQSDLLSAYLQYFLLSKDYHPQLDGVDNLKEKVILALAKLTDAKQCKN